MILLIDNYDSFTYNLVHYLGELGAEIDVRRNDQLAVTDAIELGADAILLSPGPCDPDKAGISLDLVTAAAGLTPPVPVLGVCLGHQTVGQAFGGKIVRGSEPMHGKVSTITHSGHLLFDGIPSPFRATRYHSLIVERETLPECFEITAESDDGVIMGLAHTSLPVYGVQFHPESIASEHGHRLLENFLKLPQPRTQAA
ncbi:MAG: aminodeoxychorismate/anthranilate synthase component II [Alphaproteobacteria bacterium]